MKEVNRLTGSHKLAKEALALQRLQKDAKMHAKLTPKDKAFKDLV
jgi:hypothetical protein